MTKQNSFLEIGDIIFIEDLGRIRQSRIVGVDSDETEEKGKIVYQCASSFGRLLLTQDFIYLTKKEAENAQKED